MRVQGICWDHERCVAPMGAAAAAWHERTGVRVEWDARPLAAFNDQPVSELTDAYDLLVIDHPFVGTAARTRVLAPLDELLDAGTLAELAAGAVGPSHASYAYGGHQWAFAVDAACQVSAARADTLARLGEGVPATWDEMLALAERAPGSVALPLYHSDAICSLQTLCAAAGRPLAERVDPDAVAALAALVARVDPICFAENPPALLARLRDDDRTAYVPLTFGYSVLAGEALRFGPIPAFGGGSGGALLGGAGLAVSARSGRSAEAAAFAAWVAGADAQRDVVGPAGGQPAHRAAWDDPELDARFGGFYSATRATIEAAWVRPREPWWPGFQQEAGELLVEDLRAGREPAAIARRLDDLLAARRDTDPREQEDRP